jgi:hypothetical protein
MAKPTKKDLETVEVKKATKSGSVDKRVKAKTTSQTKGAANKVIAKGNEAKTRTVGSGLGVDSARTAQSEAKRQAMLDMRGTDLEETVTGGAARKTIAELNEINGAKKKPRRERQAGSPTGYRSMEPGAEKRMISTQREFERRGPGPRKEELRKSIGLSLQSGIMSQSGSAALKQHACQGASCNNSVSMVDNDGGDVVCKDCLRKGDISGKTYKDRPGQVASTNLGNDTRKTA